MRDQYRIKIITEELMECWIHFPDIRLGQLIGNIYYTYGKNRCSLFNVEDDQWLEWIRRYKAEEQSKYIMIKEIEKEK